MMLPLSPDSLIIHDQIRSFVQSPPTVYYVKEPRHFSLSNALRSLRGECIEYYVPPPPINDKKTLILDVDETLIHSSAFPPHSRVESFRIGDPQFFVFKRPGLDEFLKFVHSNFEIFIYTYAEEQYAKPIIDHLMPWLDEDHRLYRDACGGRRGPHKDLTIFERSMKNVILVDDSEGVRSVNARNTVTIPRWTGIPSDRALIEMLPPILERCLAADDVRAVIRETQTQMATGDTYDGIRIEL
jgi:Dullard-like phosphatase family protein